MGGELEITIRPACAADLREINRIYNHAILTSTATWDEVPWPMAKRRDWFARHDASTPVLVAEVAGVFAGFAYLTLASPKSGWRFTREDTIYIDEQWRGRGVGRALLSALLDEARRLEVNLVIASIDSGNEASVALHRSLGFEVVGTHRQAGFKFERWLDTTLMQRLLREPGRGPAR